MNFLEKLIRGERVTLSDKAYAKINLFLDVTAKRADGFHDIRSYMHEVGLYDSVSVSARMSNEQSVSCTVVGDDSIPCGSDNLGAKAARAFMQWCKIRMDVEITIEKHIPVSAGLAGGSSDAAAVLRILNVMLSNVLPISELSMIAAAIGSDVPFCLVGGTKLCEGRGEEMTDVESNGKYIFVIACPDAQASTPKMYAELDEKYNNFDSVVNIESSMKESMLVPALKRADTYDIAFGLYNIFEETVLEKYEGSRLLKEKLKELGAINTLVSGSGPSVYGIFDDRSLATEAQKAIGNNAFFAESVKI